MIIIQVKSIYKYSIYWHCTRDVDHKGRSLETSLQAFIVFKAHCTVGNKDYSLIALHWWEKMLSLNMMW